MSYPSYEDSVVVPKPTPRPSDSSGDDHIARDVRKFALSQAVKFAGIDHRTVAVTITDVAAEFEDYVMNGRKK